MKDRELVLINNTSLCEGKWTRVEGEKKSILDLTIASKETLQMIKRLHIDEDNKYKKAKEQRLIITSQLSRLI